VRASPSLEAQRFAKMVCRELDDDLEPARRLDLSIPDVAFKTVDGAASDVSGCRSTTMNWDQGTNKPLGGKQETLSFAAFASECPLPLL